jgi:hypothetical protein
MCENERIELLEDELSSHLENRISDYFETDKDWFCSI